jgi:hypothetical protein
MMPKIDPADKESNADKQNRQGPSGPCQGEAKPDFFAPAASSHYSQRDKTMRIQSVRTKQTKARRRRGMRRTSGTPQ